VLTLEDLQRRRLESLRRYMVPGERVLTATHQHWSQLAEPVATTTAGLLLAAWLDTSLTREDAFLTNVLWWGWFILVGRMLWLFLERQHTWFVSTDKRLLLSYGLLNQKVAMMPMAKVTDMSYNRSILGRLFGYGTFVLESAGQEQALREITLVPRPDYIYRTICAVMFGSSDNEDHQGNSRDRPPRPPDSSGGPEGGPGSTGPSGGPRGSGGSDGTRGSGSSRRSGSSGGSGGSGGSGSEGHSPARRQPTTEAGQGSEGASRSLYRSADLGSADAPDGEGAEQGQRDADTGPIPVQRQRPQR
jgi:hypothetical protein